MDSRFYAEKPKWWDNATVVPLAIIALVVVLVAGVFVSMPRYEPSRYCLAWNTTTVWECDLEGRMTKQVTTQTCGEWSR